MPKASGIVGISSSLLSRESGCQRGEADRSPSETFWELLYLTARASAHDMRTTVADVGHSEIPVGQLF